MCKLQVHFLFQFQTFSLYFGILIPYTFVANKLHILHENYFFNGSITHVGSHGGGVCFKWRFNGSIVLSMFSKSIKKIWQWLNFKHLGQLEHIYIINEIHQMNITWMTNSTPKLKTIIMHLLTFITTIFNTVKTFLYFFNYEYMWIPES